MADVDTMSLKDLKQLIAKAGLTLDGCIEKPDLRQRAREALAALAATVSRPAAPAAPAAPTPLGEWPAAGGVEPLCAILRERFGEEALLSAGFTHFGIVETVTVLANTIAASPDEHGVPLGKVPPDVLCDVRALPAPSPSAAPRARAASLPNAACASARSKRPPSAWQAFEQTLALARGAAAGPAATPTAAAAPPVVVDGPPTDVPPGMTPDECVAWKRDGTFRPKEP